MTDLATESRHQLPWGKLVGLTFFAVSFGMGVNTLEPALLGFRILDLAPDHKNTVLGAITGAGLLIAILTQPLIGAFSDRTRTPLGRRIPYFILGSALAAGCLFAVALAPTLALLALGVMAFQAGSNAVLERMGRGYTREEYLAKVRRLREVVPSISITADVMVGFPGEEERDIAQTLDLLREVEFDGLFSFKYSPRKGTRAASLEDDVPPGVKQRRLEVLQELQRGITLKKNKELQGLELEVLVEGRSRNSPREMTGRTRRNRIVNFPAGPELVGELVMVRIKEGLRNSLRGELFR